MENNKIKKCLCCGLPIALIAGLLYESSPFCHHCLLHRQDHLPEENFGVGQYELMGISLSGSPASGATFYTSTLEDEGGQITITS